MHTNCGFRVRLDLQGFFSDERSAGWLWVSGGLRRRRAKWLLERLRRRWGLPRRAPAALSLQGRLLHPTQSLRLLRPSDTLSIIPIEKDWFEDGSALSEEENECKKIASTPIAQEVDISRVLPPQKGNDDVDGGGEDVLQREKLRALHLLDVMVGEGAGGDDLGVDNWIEAPQRAKRRRVRRRRKAELVTNPASVLQPPPAADAESLDGLPLSHEPASPPCLELPSHTTRTREPSVVHNGHSLEPRTPRLVQAI